MLIPESMWLVKRTIGNIFERNFTRKWISLFKKMPLKLLSPKCRPFCAVPNVPSHIYLSSHKWPGQVDPLLRHSCFVVTSWHGNIFRVTGPLWRESIGHRRIYLTSVSNAERLMYVWTNGWINSVVVGDSRTPWPSCDVTIQNVGRWTNHATLLGTAQQPDGRHCIKCWLEQLKRIAL